MPCNPALHSSLSPSACKCAPPFSVAKDTTCLTRTSLSLQPPNSRFGCVNPNPFDARWAPSLSTPTSTRCLMSSSLTPRSTPPSSASSQSPASPRPATSSTSEGDEFAVESRQWAAASVSRCALLSSCGPAGCVPRLFVHSPRPTCHRTPLRPSSPCPAGRCSRPTRRLSRWTSWTATKLLFQPTHSCSELSFYTPLALLGSSRRLASSWAHLLPLLSCTSDPCNESFPTLVPVHAD